MKVPFLISCLFLASLSFTGCKPAESVTGYLAIDEPLKYDFRGVWFTSVVNLDWPVSNRQTVDEQKADAIFMLDSLKSIGINAVLFQVRPESDALYASSYDPWSFWLTGEQGRAPDPFFDPLSFMIREAHKRGMELHAWLNPYRVERRKDSYPLAGSNVSRREPDWIMEFQSRPDEFYTMLDPGLPQVRDYVTNVVVDIIRRYPLDGIHFDDYFYPYAAMTDEDSLTFLAHPNGFEVIEDWRRDNVNRLMSQIHDSIQAVAPHVVFGISPFAVRKNTDAGTNAFEGYYSLYADGLAWLEERVIDYINPQLYFEPGHERADYVPLLEFWSRVARENERYMYAGLAPYRLGMPHDWSLDQAAHQLRLNLSNGYVQGNIFFRTRNLMDNMKGYSSLLKNELYRYPALTPPMAWKCQLAPPPVEELAASWSDDGRVILTWKRGLHTREAEAPPDIPHDEEAIMLEDDSEHPAETARFAIYRLGDDAAMHDLPNLLSDPRNMVAVTGQTRFVETWPAGQADLRFAVTAVSHNSIESEPVTIRIRREGDVVSFETEPK